MSATIDNRPVSSIPGFQDYQKNAVVVIDIDFSADGNALVTDETMAILDVPEDTKVKAHVKVITADSNITDFDIGLSTDGAAAADLIDGGSLAAAGYVAGSSEVLTAADKQLVITNKTADKSCGNAQIRVVVELTELD